MHRLALFTGSLLLATALSAQQQVETTSNQNPGVGDAGAAAHRDPALDRAPAAVKETIMRHAAADELQQLSSERVNGTEIYQAVLQGENTQTTLRFSENGSPLSMHIAGSPSGARVDEAAGANRQPDAQNKQADRQTSTAAETQSSARFAGPSQPAQRGAEIKEPAGAKRDDNTAPTKQSEEQEIRKLEQTQDPGELQGVPAEVRTRIQEQLGETAVEEIQPKVFYQLNIRENGQLQQVWADEKGTLLKPQQ